MQYKVVPPAPDSLDALEAARRAVPLVPRSEDDCCARVMDRVGVPARDEAKEWLTFMRALGLVSEAERGYHRTRESAGRDRLARAFRERVYGAADLLSVLDTEQTISAGEAFERFADSVPDWERQRHADWQQVWGERVERILDWAVLFGLADREGARYVRR
ncbi:hypothetical protein ACFQE8_10810 [Salinirubellus sp. GCM10025818]|uniref:hypothetical protein n=1 Tax=Salinirubellus TaxID=2162630 RepID=UPI0030CC0D91